MSHKMNRQYKTSNRKFHDAWAFILFLITTISCNIYYFSQTPKKTLYGAPDAKAIGVSVAYVVVVLGIFSGLLLTIPGPLMHSAFIISPILTMGLAFYSGNALGIIFALISSCLILLAYFFLYRKNIKYSAAVVKSSTSLILKNLISFIPLFLVSISLFLLQLAIVAKYTDKDPDNFLGVAVLILQIYWVFFTVIYFLRIYVSTTVALEIFTDTGNLDISSESYKNTFFCLGSICFGSLLVAIVATLKHLQNRSRERGNRSTGSEIIYFIVSIILSILESILRFINDWAFVYMAIYGLSYVDSIKGAFDVLTSGRNQILVNSLCLLPVISIFSFAFGIGYIYMMYKLFFSTVKTVEEVIPMIITGLVVFLVCNIYLSSFDSAAKAFLFSYEREPYSVRDKFPNTHEMLEIQKTKN